MRAGTPSCWTASTCALGRAVGRDRRAQRRRQDHAGQAADRACAAAAGTIAIDGIDLAELDLASWRRQVAVIFQDFVRYELPLTDNIQFGSIEQDPLDGAELAEIAARQAQLS